MAVWLHTTVPAAPSGAEHAGGGGGGGGTGGSGAAIAPQAYLGMCAVEWPAADAALGKQLPGEPGFHDQNAQPGVFAQRAQQAAAVEVLWPG